MLVCSYVGGDQGRGPGAHTSCTCAAAGHQESCRHRCGNRHLHVHHTCLRATCDVKQCQPRLTTEPSRAALLAASSKASCGASKAEHLHALCAVASAAKTAADQVPTPAAPAPPQEVSQAAKALKDAVPDLSAIFRDAAKGGEMRPTCKRSVPVL